MNKEKMCKEIGMFFGHYFEEGGKLCIDNGLEIFRYDTPDELLKDWLDTLVENHHDTADNPKSDYRIVNDSWEKEIVFIYSDVLGKFPSGVRLVENKDGKAWTSYVDIDDGTRHGKNLHLGTYSSIVDAIFARKEFFEKTSLCDRNHVDYLDDIILIAQNIRERASAQRQNEKLFGKESQIKAKYDLSTPTKVLDAVKYAQEQAHDNNTSQNNYEAAWLSGYAAGMQVAISQMKDLAFSLSQQEISKPSLTDQIQSASKRTAVDGSSHEPKLKEFEH